MTVPSQRPNPAQWLWYAFGGKLPQRYRDWVLHDVTCRTWWLRHLSRAIIQALPVVVVLLLVFAWLHAPAWIALVAVFVGLLVGIYYSTSYIAESNDVRLQKYGYPPRFGSNTRREAAADDLRAAQERYNAVWRGTTDKSTPPA